MTLSESQDNHQQPQLPEGEQTVIDQMDTPSSSNPPMTGPDDPVSSEDVQADLAEGGSDNSFSDDVGADDPMSSVKNPAGLDKGASNQTSSEDDSFLDDDSFSDDDNNLRDSGREAATNFIDMKIIEDFMTSYKNSLHKKYIELSRQGARKISDTLHAKKIKHHIFHREGLIDEGQTDLAAAKGIDSTRKSIIRRQEKRVMESKGVYASVDEILKEMPDLAGFRIALYFPNDFQKVDNLIRYNFEDVMPPQDWPDREHGPYAYSLLDQPSTASREITGRRSRFPGYFSRHFRVRFRKTKDLPDVIENKTFEIQVMSVLMHAWAVINQKLVYKPYAAPDSRGDYVLSSLGEIVWEPEPVLSASEDDQRLIDLTNGIIIAGEQALRQLQVNLESKRNEEKRPLWDWIQVRNYLHEKWVDDGDLNGLTEQTRLALRSALIQADWKIEPLFNSWVHLELDNRETLDKIVEGAIGVEETFPGGKYTDADVVIDRLCSFSVSLEIFPEIEAQQLGLAEKLGLRMLRSKKDLRKYMKTRPESTLVARYQALVVCNAMRFMAEECQDYVEFQAKTQILGSFKGEKPSWKVFGDFVHPATKAKPGSATLIQILNFCNYLLHCRIDPRWGACCALGRLGVFRYVKPMDKSEYVKLFVCPEYFVHYLSGGPLDSKGAIKGSHYYVPDKVTDENPLGWVRREFLRSEIIERGLGNLSRNLRDFL